MDNLIFTTQVIDSTGAPISIFHIKGELITKNLISVGIEKKHLFHNFPSYIIVDITQLKTLDISGINYLVKLRIMAMNLGVKFSVKSSYKDVIVNNIRKTKMEELLDVKYVIANKN